MNIKDIMAALKSATPEEIDAFKKSLGGEPTVSGGLTREQLDAALEPFTKGGTGPADFGGSQAAAQLDVTGWIQSVTNEVMAAVNANTSKIDEFAKSVKTLGDAVVQVFGVVETMQKSLTAAPAQGSAVTRISQLQPVGGSFAKGAGAASAAGGMVQPMDAGAGRFADLTEGQVVDYLRKAMDAEQDPIKKSNIGNALSMVELDYAITDSFFSDLGLADPQV